MPYTSFCAAGWYLEIIDYDVVEFLPQILRGLDPGLLLSPILLHVLWRGGLILRKHLPLNVEEVGPESKEPDDLDPLGIEIPPFLSQVSES